jgi:microcystin-dependent protein
MRLYGSGAPNMAMDANALAQAGGNQAHENMPPFVALNYIISLFGIFPSQS